MTPEELECIRECGSLNGTRLDMLDHESSVFRFVRRGKRKGFYRVSGEGGDWLFVQAKAFDALLEAALRGEEGKT